jgi:hypothetical protein
VRSVDALGDAHLVFDLDETSVHRFRKGLERLTRRRAA